MAFDANRTWLGVSEKSGMSFIVGGVEDLRGRVFNLANISNRANIGITSVRIGLGVGGGIGLVAVCVFNCGNIRQLNNTQTTDWGVNLSLGGRWAQVASALRRSRFFARVARIGVRLERFVPADADALRTDLHELYTAFDIGLMDSSPKIVTIDTPIGAGVEASINYTIGQIKIS